MIAFKYIFILCCSFFMFMGGSEWETIVHHVRCDKYYYMPKSYVLIALFVCPCVRASRSWNRGPEIGVFFFFGRLPRVNTRGFVFPPFSGGLPRVNTRVFFFFSFRPFPAGCPGLIPRFLFFVFFSLFFSSALFRRAAQG